MALDNAKNFAKVTVSTTYDAAATSIVLTAGHGAKLPTAPFNAVWYNSTDYSDPSDDPNVEIVRVTNISTDTLTVTRAQESTSASTKNTAGKTYKMIAGLTAKTINTDIPALAASLISATGTDIGAVKVYYYDFARNAIDTTRWNSAPGGSGANTMVLTDYMGYLQMANTSNTDSVEMLSLVGIKPNNCSTTVIEFQFRLTGTINNKVNTAIGCTTAQGQYGGFTNHTFGLCWDGTNWLFTTKSTTAQSDTLTALSVNTWYRARFEISGSGTTYKLYLDGTQVGTTHTTQVPTASTTLYPQLIQGGLATAVANGINVRDFRVMMTD